MISKNISISKFIYHAELVSASTYQKSPSAVVARWTLKQVQGDAVIGG